MSDTSDPTVSSLRRTPLRWGDTPHQQRGLPRDLAEKAVRRLGVMALIYGSVHLIYLFIPDTLTTATACLAKDPDRRPRSAQELRTRLAASVSARWDDDAATKWWRVHLPELTEAVTQVSA